jgi:hypothetical protein
MGGAVHIDNNVAGTLRSVNFTSCHSSGGGAAILATADGPELSCGWMTV